MRYVRVMRVALLCLVVAIGCREKPKDPASEAVTCERYFHHVEQLTKTPHDDPYNDAELGYCHQHSDEQLRCALAAMNVDDLGVCEQFKDPTRREVGRKVGGEIKRTWGRTELMAVLTGTPGCGFAGVMGNERIVLSETQAVVAFAVRDAGTTEDAPNILATLLRADNVWRCVETDPANMCAALETKCRR